MIIDYKIYESLLLKGDMNRFLNKIYLFKIAENVYLVKIQDDWQRALIFLRYQEYFESANDYFKRKHFERIMKVTINIIWMRGKLYIFFYI